MDEFKDLVEQHVKKQMLKQRNEIDRLVEEAVKLQDYNRLDDIVVIRDARGVLSVASMV